MKRLFLSATPNAKPEVKQILTAYLLQLNWLLARAFISQILLHNRAHQGRNHVSLVVGAGFSGLACAYELASIGYEVKVLEARRRVGGRVLSLNNLIPGKNVEGGGELLGSNHAHVMAYAAKFGFEFLDITEEDAPSPMILDGRHLSDSEVQVIEEECQSAYSSMTEDARQIHADAPWMSQDAKSLDQRSTFDWIKSLNLSDDANKLLTLLFTADNGVATQQQSYLGNLAQVKGGGLERYWTDTELYRLKGGNQQYAISMASSWVINASDWIAQFAKSRLPKAE